MRLPKLPAKPKFKDEAEEADWWYKNRKIVEARLAAIEQSGKQTPTPAQILKQEKETKLISIRLPIEDIELAKQQARDTGIRYQTLIRMLVHKGLKAKRAGA
jgi:predicted DNA binding CopG/RHH family protein